MLTGMRVVGGAIVLFWAVTACSGSTPGVGSASPTPQPKYASFAVPLAADHDYLRGAPAPDFWALSPYYVGQQNDSSCSLASLSMLVNAARLGAPLGAEDPLVTQPLLLERVDSEVWHTGLKEGGDGVTLDQLAVLARQSLAVFGKTPRRVEVTHVPAVTPEALERLRQVLRQNEASVYDWVLLNFHAGAYVGVGDYGHIAPVGAYDERQRRLLVLDPDRAWYEPYWIPEEVALAGMATADAATGQPRGYVYVSMCDAAGCGP
jgi:phytochelatin synthase